MRGSGDPGVFLGLEKGWALVQDVSPAALHGCVSTCAAWMSPYLRCMDVSPYLRCMDVSPYLRCMDVSPPALHGCLHTCAAWMSPYLRCIDVSIPALHACPCTHLQHWRLHPFVRRRSCVPSCFWKLWLGGSCAHARCPRRPHVCASQLQLQRTSVGHVAICLHCTDPKPERTPGGWAGTCLRQQDSRLAEEGQRVAPCAQLTHTCTHTQTHTSDTHAQPHTHNHKHTQSHTITHTHTQVHTTHAQSQHTQSHTPPYITGRHTS